MLQADYERGTKDGDVMETAGITGQIRDDLLALAGQNSAMHRRRGFYLDIVNPGIPFLPQVPVWHPLPALNRTLQYFDVLALDVVDVVVSKLKRFHANDRSDISAMVERELVPHKQLLERFESAKEAFLMDARAERLRTYVRNLNEIERDDLGVEESEIVLPDWIDR